ncbi:MAG: hypothetical protein IKN81_11270 [Oscillospiraceae bacterium]|nr:hypothetical protein [Oscillospiraceae bacterium]
MEYTFELRPLRNPEVLAQLADALEERAQMLAHPRREKGAVSPKERLRRRKLRYRAYLAALSLMGLALLAFALTDPVGELKSLLGGAALTGCGGVWLLLSREGKRHRDASKEQLMTQVGKAERAGARVIFDDDGMRICPARGGEELVPFQKIQFAFESSDLLVLTGSRRAMALQPLELSWGDWEELRAFLSLRIDEMVDLRKAK